MAGIYLGAAAHGLSGTAQSQLTHALQRDSPHYIDWHWGEPDSADIVFFDARFLEDIQWMSANGRTLCAVLLEEDTDLAWQVVCKHESALPLSLNGAFKTGITRVLRQHTPLLLQQAVGRQLSVARDQLEPGVSAFHLYDMRKRPVRSETPLAVVDMGRFMVMFSEQADAESILRADWVSKPSADSRLTLGYTAASLATCVWQYASRSLDDFLPMRYRNKHIFARRTHGMDPGLLKSDHLEVLQLIRDEPRTFEQLMLETRWPSARIAKALEGLYLAGTVSTQPKVAVRATQPQSPSQWRSSAFSGA